MRRTLGILLLLTLTACGSQGTSDEPATSGSPTGSASSSTPSASPEKPTPLPAEDWTQVAVITVSGAGGRVSTTAVRLDDAAAVTAFAGQFRTPALGNRIKAALRRADLAPDRTLVGAVVALGCAAPDSLRVSAADGRVLVAAGPIESSPPECLIAMTSVALVSVPTDLAPPAATS